MTLDVQRYNMIESQFRPQQIIDEGIIDLYNKIDRTVFVEDQYKNFVYSDYKIPLNNGQFMFTPWEEAFILQALNIKKHETVLEIGTGSGYLTALLGNLAQTVVSLDCFDDFIKKATLRLKDYNNIELYTSNGAMGFVDKAPYDVIILSAALAELSEMHKLQLVPGGRMIAIIENNKAMQVCLYTLDHQKNWHTKILFETVVPKMLHVEQDTFIF